MMKNRIKLYVGLLVGILLFYISYKLYKNYINKKKVVLYNSEVLDLDNMNDYNEEKDLDKDINESELSSDDNKLDTEDSDNIDKENKNNSELSEGIQSDNKDLSPNSDSKSNSVPDIPKEEFNKYSKNTKLSKESKGKLKSNKDLKSIKLNKKYKKNIKVKNKYKKRKRSKTKNKYNKRRRSKRKYKSRKTYKNKAKKRKNKPRIYSPTSKEILSKFDINKMTEKEAVNALFNKDSSNKISNESIGVTHIDLLYKESLSSSQRNNISALYKKGLKSFDFKDMVLSKKIERFYYKDTLNYIPRYLPIYTLSEQSKKISSDLCNDTYHYLDSSTGKNINNKTPNLYNLHFSNCVITNKVVMPITIETSDKLILGMIKFDLNKSLSYEKANILYYDSISKKKLDNLFKKHYFNYIYKPNKNVSYENLLSDSLRYWLDKEGFKVSLYKPILSLIMSRNSITKNIIKDMNDIKPDSHKVYAPNIPLLADSYDKFWEVLGYSTKDTDNYKNFLYYNRSENVGKEVIVFDYNTSDFTKKALALCKDNSKAYCQDNPHIFNDPKYNEKSELLRKLFKLSIGKYVPVFSYMSNYGSMYNYKTGFDGIEEGTRVILNNIIRVPILHNDKSVSIYVNINNLDRKVSNMLFFEPKEVNPTKIAMIGIKTVRVGSDEYPEYDLNNKTIIIPKGYKEDYKDGYLVNYNAKKSDLADKLNYNLRKKIMMKYINFKFAKVLKFVDKIYPDFSQSSNKLQDFDTSKSNIDFNKVNNFYKRLAKNKSIKKLIKKLNISKKEIDISNKILDYLNIYIGLFRQGCNYSFFY